MLHILLLLVALFIPAKAMDANNHSCRVKRSPGSMDIVGDAKKKIRDRLIALGIDGDYKRMDEILLINTFMDLRDEIVYVLAALQIYYSNLPVGKRRVEDYWFTKNILNHHLEAGKFRTYLTTYE